MVDDLITYMSVQAGIRVYRLHYCARVPAQVDIRSREFLCGTCRQQILQGKEWKMREKRRVR